MSENLITLDSLNAKNLPELQGLKDKQLELVKECPFVEIIDNSTYELAKKHRTALVKGRTSLESQDKLIASKLTSFRKEVKSVTDELISITLPHEEKQQEEVKRFEQIKENERLERERLENERIEKIKSTISDFESCCYALISQMTFQNAKETKETLYKHFSIDYDAQEFDILYQQAKNRVQSQFDLKHSEVQEKENQRVENELLAREKAEADAKLKAIEEQQEKERNEREKKEREEKVKVFEVRKNRLAEIGIILNSLGFFVFPDSKIFIVNYSIENIFDADVIHFENILTKAKKAIQEAKEETERLAKQKEEDERLSKLDAENLKKENKARVKRLKSDKEQLKKSIEIVKDSFITEIVFIEFPNEETENFRKSIQSKMDLMFDEVLTCLENL
jgi:colicin import membrane protein